MRCKCDAVLQSTQMESGVCQKCAEVGFYASREGWTDEDGSFVAPSKDKPRVYFNDLVRDEDIESWADGLGFMEPEARVRLLWARCERAYEGYLSLGYSPQRAYDEATGRARRGNQLFEVHTSENRSRVAESFLNNPEISYDFL